MTYDQRIGLLVMLPFLALVIGIFIGDSNRPTPWTGQGGSLD